MPKDSIMRDFPRSQSSFSHWHGAGSGSHWDGAGSGSHGHRAGYGSHSYCAGSGLHGRGAGSCLRAQSEGPPSWSKQCLADRLDYHKKISANLTDASPIIRINLGSGEVPPGITIQYNTGQYSNIHYSTVHFFTLQYSTVQ